MAYGKSKSVDGLLVGCGQRAAGTGPGGLPGGTYRCLSEAVSHPARNPGEREQRGVRGGVRVGTVSVDTSGCSSGGIQGHITECIEGTVGGEPWVLR